jgi:hypothetical protein
MDIFVDDIERRHAGPLSIADWLRNPLSILLLLRPKSRIVEETFARAARQVEAGKDVLDTMRCLLLERWTLNYDDDGRSSAAARKLEVSRS